MGRVNERGARHYSATLSHAKDRHKKTSYKILYENVTEPKKKIRTTVRHCLPFSSILTGSTFHLGYPLHEIA